MSQQFALSAVALMLLFTLVFDFGPEEWLRFPLMRMRHRALAALDRTRARIRR